MSFLRNRLRTIVGENASWYEAVSRLLYYTTHKIFSRHFYAKVFKKSTQQSFTTFSINGFVKKQEAISLINSLQHKPSIAIVVVGNDMELLSQTWESISHQYYPAVVIGFTDQLMANKTQQLWIDDSKRSSSPMPDAEYILILDQGDLLSKDALLYVVLRLNQLNSADCRAVYFWEENIARNKRVLCYKPGWDKTLINNTNAVTHALVHQSIFSWELLNNISVGLQQLLQKYNHDQIACVRKVLLQTRSEQIPGSVNAGSAENITAAPLISIIIPTRNKYHLVKQTIDSVMAGSTYKNYEIILVDNGSDEPALLEYIEQLKNNLKHKFTCVKDDKAFNFSSLINSGVQHSQGEFVVLLNNDVKLITPNWLELMVQQAALPYVGAVGAKLLYPNETIQHAGIVLGKEVISTHVFVGKARSEKVEHDAINTDQNYLALTAACLMVSRKKFDAVNGFDTAFKVEFNDIDFCLKLYANHWNNVYLHNVELFHYESASRRHPHSEKKLHRQHVEEAKLICQKWSAVIENDPFNVYSN
jgi:GT2 family glycosyltransferase